MGVGLLFNCVFFVVVGPLPGGTKLSAVVGRPRFGQIWLDLVRFVSDFVRFGKIWSDLCQILLDFVRFCEILSDFVGFCQIWLGLVGFCRIWLDLVRFG